MREEPTFNDLFVSRNWQQIPNCPGRFKLTGELVGLTPSSVVGRPLPEFEFTVRGAKDPVIVTPLGDGSGLISYRRPSGEYIHTLNTPEGLARKLANLGISIPGKQV
jgi:hypothetical protein